MEKTNHLHTCLLVFMLSFVGASYSMEQKCPVVAPKSWVTRHWKIHPNLMNLKLIAFAATNRGTDSLVVTLEEYPTCPKQYMLGCYAFLEQKPQWARLLSEITSPKFIVPRCDSWDIFVLAGEKSAKIVDLLKRKSWDLPWPYAIGFSPNGLLVSEEKGAVVLCNFDEQKVNKFAYNSEKKGRITDVIFDKPETKIFAANAKGRVYCWRISDETSLGYWDCFTKSPISGIGAICSQDKLWLAVMSSVSGQAQSITFEADEKKDEFEPKEIESGYNLVQSNNLEKVVISGDGSVTVLTANVSNNTLEQKTFPVCCDSDSKIVGDATGNYVMIANRKKNGSILRLSDGTVVRELSYQLGENVPLKAHFDNKHQRLLVLATYSKLQNNLGERPSFMYYDLSELFATDSMIEKLTSNAQQLSLYSSGEGSSTSYSDALQMD